MEKKMNKKWFPHIIATGAIMAFIVLGLASASMEKYEAEKKAKEEAEKEALQQYFLKFDEYAVGALGTDAVYWKNREVVNLPRVGVGAAGEIATSIVVSGNDVYIAGEILYSETTFEAVYWKNKQAVILPRGNARVSEATSILVSGNNVYVTGRADNDAVYWKNGQLVILPRMNATRAVANTVAISGNDAYIAGYLETSGGTQAVYWRGDGQPVTLRSGSSAVAEAIAISGNNVYVAGWSGNNAILWTNGQAAILSSKGIYTNEYGRIDTVESNMTRAKSIFVSGDDVYIGGYADNVNNGELMGATYWKNGQRTFIPSFWRDYGTSIFVIDDSVCIGGYINRVIWDTRIPTVRREIGNRNIAAIWIKNEQLNSKQYFIGPNDPVTVSTGTDSNGNYVGVYDPKQAVNSVIRDIYIVKK
jgi:hypothetical protein